jgi:hypothetical protein
MNKLPPGTKVLPSGSATAPGGRTRNNPGAMRPLSEGRNVLQYLRDKYPGFGIQESYLRMQIVFDNIHSQFQFQILLTGTETSIEQKLDKNDIFATNKLGFFLGQQTVAKPGNVEQLTFPNNSLLDGSNVTVQDFYAVYNGYLQIAIGNNVVLQQLQMKKALYVPQTQKDSISAAIAGPVTYTPFENQRDKNNGYIDLENILELSGGAQNLLTLNIATFAGIKLAFATDATKVNIGILELDGFLVKNAAYRGAA